MKWAWLLSLLPATIGVISIALLTRAEVIVFRISWRRDLDVILLSSGAIISLSTAGGLMLRQSMEQISAQRVRRALREADAERQRFLERLDHEMKNPLTAIRVGLVNLTETDDAAVRRDIQTSISIQAQRLSQLVANLRKVAELETIELEYAAVDLSDLLKDAYSFIYERSKMPNRRLALDLPLDAPLPSIQGDRDLLLLVIDNLLDNAIKFTRPDDRITLRATADENDVLIEVDDSGPGIADVDLPYVWEELYRGQGARDIPGSGIGLALVRAIIQRHNGRVMLQSGPRNGTIVKIYLPREHVSE